MNYVIIIAGGVGSRLGASVPKQFVEVLGKPVIAYTMEHFQKHQEIDAIELVCVDGFQDRLREIVMRYGITKVIKIVKGGSEYERSIMNGVAGLKSIAKPNDVVMIHWSASPFLTDEIITDNIRVCKEKGNAMTASYSYLLYGTNDGDCAKKTINRESFMTLSAPQSFLYKVIVDIYKQVEERKKLGLINKTRVVVGKTYFEIILTDVFSLFNILLFYRKALRILLFRMQVLTFGPYGQ